MLKNKIVYMLCGLFMAHFAYANSPANNLEELENIDTVQMLNCDRYTSEYEIDWNYTSLMLPKQRSKTLLANDVTRTCVLSNDIKYNQKLLIMEYIDSGTFKGMPFDFWSNDIGFLNYDDEYSSNEGYNISCLNDNVQGTRGCTLKSKQSDAFTIYQYGQTKDIKKPSLKTKFAIRLKDSRTSYGKPTLRVAGFMPLKGYTIGLFSERDSEKIIKQLKQSGKVYIHYHTPNGEAEDTLYLNSFNKVLEFLDKVHKKF